MTEENTKKDKEIKKGTDKSVDIELDVELEEQIIKKELDIDTIQAQSPDARRRKK